MTTLRSPSPRDSFDEEQAPFLSPPGPSSSLHLPETPAKRKKPWVLLVVLIFFLVAIIDMGAFLAEAPKTRVYEANICVRYYREHDPSKIKPDGTVEEALCKEDEIQQRMAMIFGWQDLFDSIPAIVLAVPFGTLADKIGRKWVFVASLIGLQLNMVWILMICYFRTLPLQLTWFSSAFYLVGGGPLVASAVGITMLSDIVPPDKRTSIFLYVTASVYVAEMIAPLMATKLMEHGDWLPLILALAIQQVGVFIGFLFPETLHLRDLPEPNDNPDIEPDIELVPNGESFVRSQMRHFRDAIVLLGQDRMLAMVIFTFLANRLGRQSITLLIRYASKRYHWEIKKANLLLSFRAATNLLALTVFIPVVNYILLKFLRLPAHFADLWIARGSIVVTTISFIVMGIAAYPALLTLGLLTFNLGTGYNAAMRSISIHAVGGQSSPDIGRLFAVIAIMESIGAMVAGPLLAGIFDLGIQLGEPFIGLPYLASALVFAGMTVVTFVISVKSEEAVYLPVEEDEPNLEPEDLTSAARARRHLD